MRTFQPHLHDSGLFVRNHGIDQQTTLVLRTDVLPGVEICEWYKRSCEHPIGRKGIVSV